MAHKLKHESKNIEVVVPDNALDFYLAHGWAKQKEEKKSATNTSRTRKSASSTK